MALSVRICPKSDPKSWNALRFPQKRRWNWTLLGLVRGKEFIPRNGPEVSGLAFFCVSCGERAQTRPDTSPGQNHGVQVKRVFGKCAPTGVSDDKCPPVFVETDVFLTVVVPCLAHACFDLV